MYEVKLDERILQLGFIRLGNFCDYSGYGVPEIKGSRKSQEDMEMRSCIDVGSKTIWEGNRKWEEELDIC